ncbi:MAG: hypothetical protein QOE30_212 [Mycobacterium sp.]|jgi:hypothetical protein|nr:hypothetical protein [Mycobacterium sp.]
MREMFEDGEADIDPDSYRLLAQHEAAGWVLDLRGRIEVESGDRMRKRGLPSPDRADAMMTTVATGSDVV